MFLCTCTVISTTLLALVGPTLKGKLLLHSYIITHTYSLVYTYTCTILYYTIYYRYDLFSTTGKDSAPMVFTSTDGVQGANADQLFVVQADKVRYEELPVAKLTTASPGIPHLVIIIKVIILTLSCVLYR